MGSATLSQLERRGGLPSAEPTVRRRVRDLVEEVVRAAQEAGDRDPSLRAALDATQVRQCVVGLLLGQRPPDWLASRSPASDGGAPDAIEHAAAALLPQVDGDPGAVYELLLELDIRRLGASSSCLRPNDVWIAAKDVLAEPPEKRSKWLQRAAGLPKSAVQKLGPGLSAARTEDAVHDALGPFRAAGAATREAGALVIDGSVERRRSGSHYTPAWLSRALVERTLAPLVEGKSEERILELRVCDPAMGSGALLVEAAAFLARAVLARSGTSPSEALRRVVAQCIHGVDKDPIAVELARWTLGRLAWPDGSAPADFRRILVGHLKQGDALVGDVSANPGDALLFRDTMPGAFDWWREFPRVFEGARGFDACVGNPPWVAYAGRAAQPLEPRLARYYEATNPAFFGYRTLHGLFVRRSAELLCEGGRLGLVVPTSVSDLDGYAPTRRAHDALCTVDAELTDFDNGAFDGVFQPCMALTSTRRSRNVAHASTWSLARADLDAVATRLLEKLGRLPRMKPESFGERGYQTAGDDLSHLRRLDAAEPPYVVPIREGVDIAEFAARPPRTFLDPRTLSGRLRPASDYERVSVLVRQTARYPIAALSDGVAFRNSILAAFADDEWSAPALASYLNSSVVRWHHFMRHRDARQGMPQLKVGHLRAIPHLDDSQARAALDAFGRGAAERNSGVSAAERAELDAIVFDALRLEHDERELVRTWAAANPPPKPRSRDRSS